MQAIFMARGPYFNEKVQIETLNNVDVYHVACRILDLQPNPYAQAGSLANLSDLFRKSDQSSTSTRSSHGLSLNSVSPFLIFFLLFHSF